MICDSIIAISTIMHCQKKKMIIVYLYYYLKDFPYLDWTFFWFQNTPTLLSLSRDETKEQLGKNISLTLTKTLPTK